LDELDRVCRERDFYLGLLDLDTAGEIEPFLRDALACIVELTSAQQAYLEIHDEQDGSDAGGHWWMAHGCSDQDVERIRSSISRGIVAEALATGETVSTDSALLDARFRDRESVRRERIAAVLCAPIGADDARGVVYLQGRDKPGPFSGSDRAAAERFARHLASLASSLLARRRAERASDCTRALRERHRLDLIVGRSPALAAALEEAMLAAPLDVSVLLTGESGTGKGELARAIHENSRRASGPFVELNCAAIPTTLIESELFGARSGAHAEARRDRAGKVAAAEGGTLLLDEISELPLDAQAKLLQLLQSRTYYPLGATQPVHANARLIAATNRNLEEAVREKRLREDLYYRLRVLPIRLPSLSERPGDVPDLARALCRRACQRHGLAQLELSPSALLAVEAAEWPGNVRQLENALEAAVIRAAGRGSRRVESDHVFPREPRGPGHEDGEPSFQEATRRFQCELLERTLRETEWNVSETARRLDLARSHVYNLVKTFGLARGGEDSGEGGSNATGAPLASRATSSGRQPGRLRWRSNAPRNHDPPAGTARQHQ
jgi:Nif-specific regulatory protein